MLAFFRMSLNIQILVWEDLAAFLRTDWHCGWSSEVTWRVSLKAFGWVSNSIKSGLWGLLWGRIPLPRLELSSGEPGLLITLIWSSADHLLQFTDWRWLNAWLDPMITSYHMHAQISLTNTHSHPQCSRCLFSPVHCLSLRGVCANIRRVFQRQSALCGSHLNDRWQSAENISEGVFTLVQWYMAQNQWYTEVGGPPLERQNCLDVTNSPAPSLEGLGLRRKESTTSTKQASAMVQGWELVKAEKNNVASFVEWKQLWKWGQDWVLQNCGVLACSHLHKLLHIWYWKSCCCCCFLSLFLSSTNNNLGNYLGNITVKSCLLTCHKFIKSAIVQCF